MERKGTRSTGPHLAKSGSSGVAEHPVALQLRYLQTMREMSSESNTTTFFPIPMELFRPFFPQAAEPDKK